MWHGAAKRRVKQQPIRLARYEQKTNNKIPVSLHTTPVFKARPNKSIRDGSLHLGGTHRTSHDYATQADRQLAPADNLTFLDYAAERGVQPSLYSFMYIIVYSATTLMLMHLYQV